MEKQLINTNVVPGFTSGEAYKLLWNMSVMFSKTALVPEIFRNKPEDCAVAINMAVRLKADPLMVMQNMYIVYGSPAWSSKFLISTFNQCGKYSSIKYKMVGNKGTDDYGCIAYATELATGEKLEGPLVTIGLSKHEGWYNKKGSKWVSMPEQMLRYRAAAWFIRTTAPELSMGLQTKEEMDDVKEKDITPTVENIIEQAQKEVKKSIASKTLAMPEEKVETKIEQKITEIPKDNNAEKVEVKNNTKNEQVIIEQEELTPAKPPF